MHNTDPHMQYPTQIPLLESLQTIAQHRLQLLDTLSSSTFEPFVNELSSHMAESGADPVATLMSEVDSVLTVVPALRDEVLNSYPKYPQLK